jgi:competence ComEA-like helix-hairpin-helix protein
MRRGEGIAVCSRREAYALTLLVFFLLAGSTVQYCQHYRASPAPVEPSVPVSAPNPAGQAPAEPSPAANARKVDLNTAGAAELEALPGIGPVLAGRIIVYRSTHGHFGSVRELLNITGIGEKRYAALRDLVCVE